MEKRWSERKMLQLHAELYQRGEKRYACSCRNVSLGGTFLELSPMPEIHKDDSFDVVFYLHPEGTATKHRLSARVARVTGNGVGFKYFNFDTSAFRSLQEIMGYNEEQQAALSS